MDLSSLIVPAGVFVIILGVAGLVYSVLQDRKHHSHVRGRLHVSFEEPVEKASVVPAEEKRRRGRPKKSGRPGR